LPEINDEFATAYGAENLEKLREGVQRDLENELKLKRNNVIRNQIVESLLRRVDFELPEALVANETKNVVYDVVREQHERGVSREAIDQKKEAIYSYASGSARDRLKAAFLLGRIAEKENITATKEELTRRVITLANQYQIKPEQFINSWRSATASPRSTSRSSAARCSISSNSTPRSRKCRRDRRPPEPRKVARTGTPPFLGLSIRAAIQRLRACHPTGVRFRHPRGSRTRVSGLAQPRGQPFAVGAGFTRDRPPR